MRMPVNTVFGSLLTGTLLACVSLPAEAQDSSQQAPALGDVARKTRQERSTAGHAPGKQLANDEEDGPDSTGMWRVRSCSRTPCDELSIALPKSAQWTRVQDGPRPVLIPLPGQEQDAGRVIRVYAAESLGTMYTQQDGAKRLFLQGWFARPEYFGQAARIVLDEHILLDSANATISHFTVAASTAKYRGLSIVASAANGSYGFACVFRDDDSAAAISICDAIIRSARNNVLIPERRPVYPNYQPPASYPRYDDPPIDPLDGRPENEPLENDDPD
jgi:hypothetical protein